MCLKWCEESIGFLSMLDINYDDYKEGLLHLIGESQQTLSLNDTFMMDV